MFTIINHHKLGGGSIKTFHKTIIGIVTVMIFFFVVFPFIFVGSPTPLFSIWNQDTVTHEVTVEIFGPTNQSMLKEKYVVESDERITEEKSLLMVFRTLFKGTESGYLVVATLDDNSTVSQEIAYHPWNEMSIDINDNELSIGEITV